MALIQCPECGSRISDKALSCPYCGFTASGEMGLVPISSLPPAPQRVAVAIPEASVFDDGTGLITRSDREMLAKFMTNANNMAELAPAIHDAVQKLMEKRGTVWAADFSVAAQKLMDKKELVLAVEKKTGQFLPQLRDAKTGKIYENARLHAEQLPNDLASSLATIQTQVMLASLMREIQNVAASVEALRLENKGDRIGRAKGVWLELQQAANMLDPRLREQRLLGIASKATEQRSILQESFEVQLQLATSRQGNANKRGQAAEDAIVYLTTVTLMARSEYVATELVGEKEAARTALRQFESFVEKNRLDDENTLRALNSKSRVNLEGVTKGFYQIATNVKSLSLKAAEPNSISALPEGDPEE